MRLIMAKILSVDLQNSDVKVGMDDGSVAHVSLKEFNFIPQVNSIVEIFKDGDSYVVNQTTKPLIPVNSNNSNSGDTVVISRVTFVMLAWFLGAFGAHKFYEGKIGVGFAYIGIFISGLLLLAPLLAIPVLIIIDLVEALKAKSVESDVPGMIEIKKGGFFLTAVK